MTKRDGAGLPGGRWNADRIGDPAALVGRLGACLTYADEQQDYALAALISTAYELAVERLAAADASE